MIKIDRYDPQTGKGYYQISNGRKIAFRYKDFKDEKAVWPGSFAKLKNGKIVKTVLFSGIRWKIRRALYYIKNYFHKGD